jgi:hypothetical protein
MKRLLFPSSSAAIWLSLTLSLPGQVSTQTIRGALVDDQTGSPIDGASVMLVDPDERVAGGVLSDSTGFFILTAPRTGRYRLRLERLGYHTTTSTEIDLLPPDTLQVEFRMSVEPVAVPGLTIINRDAPLVMDTRLARLGFYDRRAHYGVRGTASSHFLDYDDIQERHPGRATDMFTALSGVRVIPTGRRGMSVRSMRGFLTPMGQTGCNLTFYLDGVRITLDRTESINDYVLPSHLSAIEVYLTAPYPLQYAPAMGHCGCILVWTGFVEGKGGG